MENRKTIIIKIFLSLFTPVESTNSWYITIDHNRRKSTALINIIILSTRALVRKHETNTDDFIFLYVGVIHSCFTVKSRIVLILGILYNELLKVTMVTRSVSTANREIFASVNFHKTFISRFLLV